MTTERIQSEIKEVRDQLSLDFADSEYLNVISRNLGMDRPILGFTDDSWRAVVKLLALEYKQISNKFRDVLEVIFGPRVTEVATLAEDVVLGDAECVLNDTSNLPQLGTLVFDEGSASEETLVYCYIDRLTNTVYLETNFGAAHSARDFDSEEPIVLVDGTKVVCRKTNNFPITNYPYPIVLGRGTANEEVVQVVDNDLVAGTLTLSSAPLNSHATLRVGDIFDQLNQPYFALSSFLQVEDSTQFPPEGYIKLRASGDATGTAFVLTANTPAAADDFVELADNTFVAATQQVTDMVFANTAGTQTDIQSVGGSLPSFVVGDRFEVEGANTAGNDGLYEVTVVNTENEDYTVERLDGTPADDGTSSGSELVSHSGEIVGYEVVFTGNTTAALAGVTRRITSATDSYVSFDDDFTGPAAAPATGDEFTLLPIVQYVSLDYGSNTLTLRAPILETNLTIPLNSTVELMVVEETAALSPVKFAGTGWDVIQTTPRLVELLIPEDIRDPNDLRSSSHIHDDTLPTTSTTNSVQVDPADTIVEAASFASFPDAGTLELDPGGGSAERQPYGRAISEVKTYVAEGAGTVVLVNSRNFPSTGSVLLNPGADNEETLAYSSNVTATGTLTLTGTTTNEHRVGEVAKCDTELRLQSTGGATNTHAIGTTVQFYQPKYGSTDVPIGDFNQQQQTWPGPYVYSLDERAATATVALTNTTSLVPGTTGLLLGQASGFEAIEVEDGLSMLEGISTPFDLRLGAGSSREEVIQVDSVAIKGRASTTLAADPALGATVIQATSLAPHPAGEGGTFPEGGGYRIVINEAGGVGTLEVAYVISTTTVVNASAAIGAGANGTIGITAVGSLAGVAGNSATVEVVDPTPTNGPLTAVESPAGTLTVTLAVAGGVLDTPSNTATLVAAAIDALPNFSATATGTGADSLAAAEGPTSFVGGFDGFLLEDPLTIDHPNGATVDLMADVLEIQGGLTKTHNGFTARSQRSTAQAEATEAGQGVNAYASLRDTSSNPELVQPLIGGVSGGITLASAVGLDTDGGNVIFNFGNGALPVEATIDAPVSAAATTISVDSSDAFPAPTSRFTAIIGEGTPNEERVLVNANDTGTDVLTIGDGTHGVQYAHAVGETVRFEPGAPEDIEYSEVDGSILRFDPEIVLQYTHYPVETVVDSSATSDPKDNGYDFPFRMPIDIRVRLEYLLDIIRAAGVQVELITQR